MATDQPVERRFIFNGSAVAFAGRIRRPDDVFVKAAAASHLPVTGGLSETSIGVADTKPFLYKDVITFGSASSRAQGDFSDPRKALDFTHGNHGQNILPANTTVQAVLTDLRIDAQADPTLNSPRRIFQAKKLQVHMESTTNRRDPVSFRSFSADFEGITLTTVTAGSSGAVELKVHTATDIFSSNDTKAKLMETYAKDGDFRKNYAACFYPPGANLPGLISNLLGRHEIPNAHRGAIVATFVTGLEWVGGVAPVGTEIVHNRLTIAGLGRIFFGEIIIEEGMRRASLLRFELGSITGGECTAAEVTSNGTDTSQGDPP